MFLNHADFSGVIFDIQRFSIHDGPGIRTTVFLKGCPLNCFWCHNPEGLGFKKEIQFYPEKCIVCGECVLTCQQGAHQIEGGLHTFDRQKCITCGECVVSCCAEAVQIVGEDVSVEYVIKECLRDKLFYEGVQGERPSRGGVTLSGGEPLSQPDFTHAVLEGLRAEGVHTAIETSAFFNWERIEHFLPWLDLVIMDLKHMDSTKHKAVTGVSNDRILANAHKIAETGIPLIFHTPVIPTVNDTPVEITAIAQFVLELETLRPAGSEPLTLELLPFHKLAGDKYRSLDMDYRALSLNAPTKDHLAVLLKAAQKVLPDAICK